MIAEIGLMIGLYIITRMVSFILRTGERKESAVVYLLAVITIIVACFFIFDVCTRGISIPSITWR
jgi:hypothetical protein